MEKKRTFTVQLNEHEFKKLEDLSKNAQNSKSDVIKDLLDVLDEYSKKGQNYDLYLLHKENPQDKIRFFLNKYIKKE